MLKKGLLTGIMASVLLTGCSLEEAKQSDTITTLESTKESTIQGVTESNEKETDETKASTVESVETVKDSKELYEKFVNGEIKATLGSLSANMESDVTKYLSDFCDYDWYWKNAFQEKEEFTLQELYLKMLNIYFDSEDYFKTSAELYHADYALIDMGRDGQQELIVRFVTIGQYSNEGNHNVQFMFENVNGSLELTRIYAGDFSIINENGVVKYSYEDVGELEKKAYWIPDQDRNFTFFYYANGADAWDGEKSAAFEIYEEICENSGIENPYHIEIWEYSFEDFWKYDGENYPEDVKLTAVSTGVFDEDGVFSYDPENGYFTDEEDQLIADTFDLCGYKRYTKEEINELIEKRCEEIGHSMDDFAENEMEYTTLPGFEEHSW